ncbi:MAG: SURF1 family protein [Methylotenera sp.]|nr:SURF1 family protein [Methylotenera sp.]
MKPIQLSVYRYIFRPNLIGVLSTLICIPLFINFGLWQYNKAQQKIAIQVANNHAEVDKALQFPLNQTLDIADWKYKKVTVTGVYETKYQFLLDNQLEGDRVGFHVITPLKIDHTSQYVLVNRGWISAKDTHADLPTFTTPSSLQTVFGQVWVPSKKIFSLENRIAVTNSAARKNDDWKVVWQHMDIDGYKKRVPFTVSDMAIKLDPVSNAGGFVRHWQIAAERIITHMGYAYQWFGFALATLLIFIYMSFSKILPEQ